MQPSIDPNFDLRIRSLDSNQTSRLLNQKNRLVVTQQLNLPHRNARGASSTKGASLRQSLPHSLSHSPKNHDLLQSLARPKSALNRVPSNRMSISLVKYHSSYRFVSHPNRKGAIPQLKEKQRSEVGLIYRSMNKRNVTEENNDKLLNKNNKFRSSAVQLEAELAVKLKELQEDPDYSEAETRRRALKVYSDMFDQIISQSPFSSILAKIKDAYERDPNVLNNSIDMRRSYDSTIIQFSQVNAQAQNYIQQIAELHKTVAALQRENKSLKLALKRNKKLVSEEENTTETETKVEENTRDVTPSENVASDPLEIPPFDFTDFTDQDDDTLVALRYRERKHLLESQLVKAKFKVQEISKALKLFLIESGEVKLKRRKKDDYDFENDSEIIKTNPPDDTMRSMIASPTSKSKLYRIQVEQTNKSLLDDDQDSESSEVEVIVSQNSSVRSSSTTSASSPVTTPTHSRLSRRDSEREAGLSVRERTLSKVKRQRLREASSSRNLLDLKEVEKRSKVELDPGAILDIDKLWKDSLLNEESLQQHIQSFGQNEDNLTFLSDAEDDTVHVHE